MSSVGDMPENLHALDALIRHEFGIDFSSNYDQLARKIRPRLAATGCADVEAYLRFLADPATAEAELPALVDEVANNETYFFREQAQLALVCGDVVSSLVERDASRSPLKILSVPCSSGEEPYSIAMNLESRKQPVGSRIAIFGADVSTRALSAAKRAVYRKYAFRGVSPEMTERFFRYNGKTYEIDARIRDTVEFAYANLIAPTSLMKHAPYDIIFCRNVMIYFDTATQTHVLENLAHLLVPGGILCLGHADAAPGFASWYERFELAGATFYERKALLPDAMQASIV